MLRNSDPNRSPVGWQKRSAGWCRFLLIPALAAILAGCAAPLRFNRPPAADPLIDHYLLTTVPFIPQDAYQCGPASLAMVLAWSGNPVPPQALTEAVFTPSLKGSLQPAMIAAARRHDRIAYLMTDARSLLNEIAAGHPVIVLQNLGLRWYPVWHYAVVIGVDLRSETVILHSGTTPRKRLAWKTFSRTWARSGFWALLVLPPSELPATASETDYLAAVGHLERLGRWPTAIRAYQAALHRWPRSLAATVGLGVCFYQAGDLGAAEAVLRTATRTFPDQGVIYNNLAQVLIDRGQRDEALQAALKAVELGGPLKTQFQNTLESIRSQ